MNYFPTAWIWIWSELTNEAKAPQEIDHPLRLKTQNPPKQRIFSHNFFRNFIHKSNVNRKRNLIQKQITSLSSHYLSFIQQTKNTKILILPETNPNTEEKNHLNWSIQSLEIWNPNNEHEKKTTNTRRSIKKYY